MAMFGPFTAVVEDEKIKFTVPWKGHKPPDLLVMPDGTALVYVGEYKGAERTYGYRKPVICQLNK